MVIRRGLDYAVTARWGAAWLVLIRQVMVRQYNLGPLYLLGVSLSTVFGT